jgi:phosphoenolpyruvate synthase/pyruvate phosphate dikinase
MPMLRWLSELSDKDSAEVGPKIARLGALRASGIEVPDGFVITTTAFEKFLARNDLARRVERELESAPDADNLVAIEVASLAYASSSSRLRWSARSKAHCVTLMTNFVFVMVT